MVALVLYVHCQVLLRHLTRDHRVQPRHLLPLLLGYHFLNRSQLCPDLIDIEFFTADLLIVKIVKVKECALNLALDVVVLGLVRSRHVTIRVTFINTFDPHLISLRLYQILSVPEQPLLISYLIPIQHVLLSIRQFVEWLKIQIFLGSFLKIIANVSWSIRVQIIKICPDVSLNQSRRVQLLPQILEEIVTNELLLLENDELLALKIDFVALAEAQLQLLVLQAFECPVPDILVPLLFENIRLQICQLL